MGISKKKKNRYKVNNMWTHTILKRVDLRLDVYMPAIKVTIRSEEPHEVYDE
jgi:hypothetical protein